MLALKNAIRDVYARTLAAAGLSRPARWGLGRHLILTFHRVLPESLRATYPLPGLVATPEELRWVLEALLGDFACLPVSEAWGLLRSGRADRPLMSVTFDDGQLDNYEYAAPVLADLGVRATFYVPTAAIGGLEPLWHDRVGFAWRADRADTLRRLAPYIGSQAHNSLADVLERLKRLEARVMEAAVSELSCETPHWAMLMSWDQIVELRDRGHEIGSHSASHRLLSTMTRDEQAMEIEESRSVLERRLGQRVPSFCYPNGSFDSNTLELVQAAGFENAVSTQWGLNEVNDEPMTLRRCDMVVSHLKDRKGAMSARLLRFRLSPYRLPKIGGVS